MEIKSFCWEGFGGGTLCPFRVIWRTREERERTRTKRAREQSIKVGCKSKREQIGKFCFCYRFKGPFSLIIEKLAPTLSRGLFSHLIPLTRRKTRNFLGKSLFFSQGHHIYWLSGFEKAEPETLPSKNCLDFWKCSFVLFSPFLRSLQGKCGCLALSCACQSPGVFPWIPS